jgi:hypothetical protein
MEGSTRCVGSCKKYFLAQVQLQPSNVFCSPSPRELCILLHNSLFPQNSSKLQALVQALILVRDDISWTGLDPVSMIASTP